MVQLLLSQNAITVYEILIIVILVIVFIRQNRKNRDFEERRNISNEKMRNAALEEKLKNPESRMEMSRKSNPFEVQYTDNYSNNNETVPDFQVEIEVYTETSVQRHLFDLEREIFIGQDKNNDLVLNDVQAVKRGCSICMKDHAVYIKNRNSAPSVSIRRGKNHMVIQNQMVKLQTNDFLTVGKTEMHISIYEN